MGMRRGAQKENQQEAALPRVGWPRTCPGDPTPAREREHEVRSARERKGRSRSRGRRRRKGGNGGTDVLVEEVAVNGPVERVLERPAVEQTHPLLLRRPPRQVPCRGRHRPPRRRRRCSFPSLSSRCSSRVGGLGIGFERGHGLAGVYGLFGLDRPLGCKPARAHFVLFSFWSTSLSGVCTHLFFFLWTISTYFKKKNLYNSCSVRNMAKKIV